MAINLPTGFNITNIDPIDARFTVSNESERLGFSPVNVYEGLVVYQRDTNKLYVLIDTSLYNQTTGWQEIGISSGSSGSIQSNQIVDYSVTASVNGLTPNSVFLVTSGSEPLLQLNNQGDLQIFGNLIAEQYIISSSVTYYTQSFASGSNVFGDDITDTHIFTGSLFVTGSKIEIMSQNTTTFIAYIETGSGEIKFSNIIDGGLF